MDKLQRFASTLEGEIDLRDEMSSAMLEKGRKAYLLIRNLGTLTALVTTIGYLKGLSAWVCVVSMWMPLIFIWWDDYVNYAGRSLVELRLIEGLKILRREVVCMTPMLAKSDKLDDFIAERMIEISPLRQGCVFVSESMATERGLQLLKKRV